MRGLVLYSQDTCWPPKGGGRRRGKEGGSNLFEGLLLAPSEQASWKAATVLPTAPWECALNVLQAVSPV